MATDSDNSSICQALLHRAGRGDAAAFAGLYDRTAPEVFSLIRAVLPDVRQVEDVTIEVYLHAWRTASQYDAERDDARALLMATAGRFAVERIRAAPHRDGVPQQPSRADPAGRPTWAHLLAAVPVAAREVLVLTYFSGHDLATVAELLGIPRATAVAQLNDALSHLRRGHGGHQRPHPGGEAGPDR